MSLELLAAAPDGTRRAGLTIDVAVTRRVWKSIRRNGTGDRWETITEPVDEPAAWCRVTTAETPQPCRFTPEAGGLCSFETYSLPAESDARRMIAVGACGITVDAGDGQALADAIARLASDRALGLEMVGRLVPGWQADLQLIVRPCRRRWRRGICTTSSCSIAAGGMSGRPLD